MGEDKEQIAIAQTSDKKSDGESGTMRRHGNDSTEKTAMLNTTSPSNLEARLASAIVNNTLSPESEEKAEVEPLSYDGRGFEETKEAVCSRSSSFGDDGSFSKLRHSPNSHQVDFKELRPALSKDKVRAHYLMNFLNQALPLSINKTHIVVCRTV